jgi:hypothetical protein
VDDGDNCFVAGGPASTLRAITGGIDGDQLWTYATASASAANYAEWWLPVAESGRYRIELAVNAGGAVGNARQVKYGVRHANGDTMVTLDQRSRSGFFSLGEFFLSSASAARVRVNDNTGEAGSLHRKIVFDAVKAVRIDQQSVDTCSQVRVNTSGDDLNVRPTASTADAAIGTVSDNALLTRLSTANGQSVDGVTTWYRIESGDMRGWITGRYAACAQ